MKHLSLSTAQFESREGYERSVLLTENDMNGSTKIQLMRLAPLQAIKPHHHLHRTECFRIVSGTGIVRINGKAIHMKEDDIILCQPGDVHEFINHSETLPLVVMVVRTNDSGNNDMIWEDN